jgi:hypothetical protein
MFKKSYFKLAPPIKNPSTSCKAIKSLLFLSVTLPKDKQLNKVNN